MKNREKFIEQFNKLPTIESQLPVTFSNGACFEELNGTCNECHESIESDNFRGIINKTVDEFTAHDGSVKTDEKADLTAYGCCASCHELTPFRYMLSAPGGELMITEVKENGLKHYKSRPFDYDSYWKSLL